MTRLVGAVQHRRTFVALRRPAGRATSGPLSVSWVPPATQDAPFPQVSYSIGRQCGTAVRRNRLRRRLRAAVSATVGELVPGSYLVRPSPRARDLGFAELTSTVRSAMARAAERGRDR